MFEDDIKNSLIYQCLIYDDLPEKATPRYDPLSDTIVYREEDGSVVSKVYEKNYPWGGGAYATFTLPMTKQYDLKAKAFIQLLDFAIMNAPKSSNQVRRNLDGLQVDKKDYNWIVPFRFGDIRTKEANVHIVSDECFWPPNSIYILPPKDYMFSILAHKNGEYGAFLRYSKQMYKIEFDSNFYGNSNLIKEAWSRGFED
jgi:hypothetical protein